MKLRPNEKCVTGKKLYPSLQIAEEALIEAHMRFDFAPANGPVAVYLCEDCGRYHLTSKGKMNSRLEELMKNGTISRQKEANRWVEKFKRY